MVCFSRRLSAETEETLFSRCFVWPWTQPNICLLTSSLAALLAAAAAPLPHRVWSMKRRRHGKSEEAIKAKGGHSGVWLSCFSRLMRTVCVSVVIEGEQRVREKQLSNECSDLKTMICWDLRWSYFVFTEWSILDQVHFPLTNICISPSFNQVYTTAMTPHCNHFSNCKCNITYYNSIMKDYVNMASVVFHHQHTWLLLSVVYRRHSLKQLTSDIGTVYLLTCILKFNCCWLSDQDVCLISPDELWVEFSTPASLVRKRLLCSIDGWMTT